MQYIFDELNFIKNIKSDLEAIFNNEEVFNIIGKEVEIIKDTNNTNTVFPCIFIRVLNSSTNDVYSTVEQGQRFTNLTIEFDCYSNELSNYTKDESIIYISQILIQKLTEKYPLINMSFNQFMPNLDTFVARKIIRFTCTIDNKTNYIYNK